MQSRLTMLRAQPRPSLCSSSDCSAARMLRLRAFSTWSRKSRSSRNSRKRLRTSQLICMAPASCAAARSGGKAVRSPASSRAPETKRRRDTGIMARIFNGKVEAEIRELLSACNNGLAVLPAVVSGLSWASHFSGSRSAFAGLPQRTLALHRRHLLGQVGLRAGLGQPSALLPGLHHIHPELACAHDGDGKTERDHEIEDAEDEERGQ